MPNTFPANVLIIRHGEKLGDPSKNGNGNGNGSPNLSIQGSARAAAIPSLFVPAKPALDCSMMQNATSFSLLYCSVQLSGDPPRFPTPDFIFATDRSKNSNRPIETITPLAAALNLHYDSKHADDDYAKVASDILTDPKYAGKTVLICWHHGKIPQLAQALGVSNPPDWKGHVFDRVWHITYPSGKAALKDLPQQLLFGDSKD